MPILIALFSFAVGTTREASNDKTVCHPLEFPPYAGLAKASTLNAPLASLSDVRKLPNLAVILRIASPSILPTCRVGEQNRKIYD